MLAEKESNVLITKEACDYLRISRPTYVKYLATGRIRATQNWIGFCGEEWRLSHSQMPHRKIIVVIRFKEEVENGEKV